MKLLPFFLLLFTFYISNAQQEEFQLKGKILNSNHDPVSDAYIINFRDLKKVISQNNGDFNMWVQPGDSLMISHISYYRKKIYVDKVKINPFIILQIDTINIIRVDVSPNHKEDEDRARDNLKFLTELEVPSYTKIKPEMDPVNQMILENNKLMRSEASSISLYRFSPSEQIGKILQKFRKRKKSNQYSSIKNKKRAKKTGTK